MNSDQNGSQKKPNSEPSEEAMTTHEITNYSPISNSVAGILYSDLELIDRNFRKRFEDRELKCSVCGESLLDNGIYAVVQVDSELKWCCSNIDCTGKFD